MNTDLWKKHMRQVVDTHTVLKHEFFHLITEGEAKERIVSWALQDRHVSYMFPRLIAQIITVTPVSTKTMAKARLALIENLWEEGGDGNIERAHTTLMDNFLVSMGVKELEVVALPSTLQFMELQCELARESALAGASAFCYANEYLALMEYNPILDAVLACQPSANIGFFRANQEVDGHHTELVEEFIIALCAGEEDFIVAEHAAKVALDARGKFYDELVKLPVFTS